MSVYVVFGYDVIMLYKFYFISAVTAHLMCQALHWSIYHTFFNDLIQFIVVYVACVLYMFLLRHYVHYTKIVLMINMQIMFLHEINV